MNQINTSHKTSAIENIERNPQPEVAEAIKNIRQKGANIAAVFKSLSPNLQNNVSVATEAIRYSSPGIVPNVFQQLSSQMQNNISVATEAIRYSSPDIVPNVFQQLSSQMQTKSIALIALGRNSEVYEHLHATLKTDLDIIRQVLVSSTGKAFCKHNMQALSKHRDYRMIVGLALQSIPSNDSDREMQKILKRLDQNMQRDPVIAGIINTKKNPQKFQEMEDSNAKKVSIAIQTLKKSEDAEQTFLSLPAEIRNHPQVVVEVLRRSGNVKNTFLSLPAEIRNDYRFASIAIRKDYTIYKDLSQELQENPVMIETTLMASKGKVFFTHPNSCMINNPKLLECAWNQIQSNRMGHFSTQRTLIYQMASSATRVNPIFIQCLLKNMSDRDRWDLYRIRGAQDLAYVVPILEGSSSSNAVSIFIDTGGRLAGNREVILPLVGRAAAHAIPRIWKEISQEMQEDPEIIICVLSKMSELCFDPYCRDVINSISKDVWKDKNVMIRLLERSSGDWPCFSIIDKMDAQLKDDIDIFKLASPKISSGNQRLLLSKTGSKIKDNRQFIQFLLRQSFDRGAVLSIFEWMSPNLQCDQEVVSWFVQQVPAIIEEYGLKDNKRIVLACVEKQGLALQYVGPLMQNDPDVVLAAITQNRAAAAFVGGEAKKDPRVSELLKSFNATNGSSS
ncbi:MAG: DUF4116 domain-containing protein [Chlamydiales bacterium]